METSVAEEPDVTSWYPGISLGKGESWAGASEPEKYPIIFSVDPWAVCHGRDKKDQKTISKM